MYSLSSHRILGDCIISFKNGFKLGGEAQEGLQRDRAEHKPRALDASQKVAEGARTAHPRGEAPSREVVVGPEIRKPQKTSPRWATSRAEADLGGGENQEANRVRIQYPLRYHSYHAGRFGHMINDLNTNTTNLEFTISGMDLRPAQIKVLISNVQNNSSLKGLTMCRKGLTDVEGCEVAENLAKNYYL